MKLDCPHCHRRLSVSDRLEGTQGHCPACKQKIEIPRLTALQDSVKSQIEPPGREAAQDVRSGSGPSASRSADHAFEHSSDPADPRTGADFRSKSQAVWPWIRELASRLLSEVRSVLDTHRRNRGPFWRCVRGEPLSLLRNPDLLVDDRELLISEAEKIGDDWDIALESHCVVCGEETWEPERTSRQELIDFSTTSRILWASVLVAMFLALFFPLLPGKAWWRGVWWFPVVLAPMTLWAFRKQRNTKVVLRSRCCPAHAKTVNYPGLEIIRQGLIVRLGSLQARRKLGSSRAETYRKSGRSRPRSAPNEWEPAPTVQRSTPVAPIPLAEATEPTPILLPSPVVLMNGENQQPQNFAAATSPPILAPENSITEEMSVPGIPLLVQKETAAGTKPQEAVGMPSADAPRAEEATYILASPVGELPPLSKETANEIEKIVAAYQILRGISPLPKRPIPEEQNDQGNSAQGGASVGQFAKGVGATFLLAPLLGQPLATMIGAGIANQNSSASSGGRTPEKSYTPQEWREKCQNDALKTLKDRGFPVDPPQLLDTLMAALNYRSPASLMNILESEHEENARRGAVVALGYLGTAGTPGIPLLVQELQQPGVAVRDQVFRSLRQIVKFQGAVEAVPPILNLAVTTQDADLRQRAVVVLGEIGANAVPAVPFLISQLKSHHFEMRSRAAKSLGKIGANAKRALKPLWEEALSPNESPPNSSALEAIAQIQGESTDVWKRIVLEATGPDAKRAAWVEKSFTGMSRSAAKNAGDSLVEAVQSAAPEHRKILLGMLRHANRKLAHQHSTAKEKLLSFSWGSVGCVAVLVVVILLGMIFAIRNFRSANGNAARGSAGTGTASGEVTETEVRQLFRWTPPVGWQRGGFFRRTGLLGGNILREVITSASDSSATVTLDFKREQISDADMLARLVRTLNGASALGGNVTRPPDQIWGTRTIHLVEMRASQQTLRMYVWMVPERNIYSAISVKCNPSQFDKRLAELEPTFRQAVEKP